MSSNTYKIQYAKQGRATCKYKKCSQTIAKDTLRLGKCYPSPFSSEPATDWFHAECIFKAMENAKKDTKVPDSIEAIQGFDDIKDDDKKIVEELVNSFAQARTERFDNLKKKTNASKTSKPKKGLGTSEGPGKQQTTLFNFSMISQPSLDNKPAPKETNTPTQTVKSTTKSGFESLIPNEWQPFLIEVLENMPDSQSLLSEKTLPSKLHIFDSIKEIEPKDVKLIVFGPSPISDPKAVSGYAFHDSRDETFESSKGICIQNIVEAAKTHAPTLGDSVDWDSYKKTKIEDWLVSLKRQGVLFLNLKMSVSADDQVSGDSMFYSKGNSMDAFWGPIVLKIIKTVLEEKKASSSQKGVVIALFGNQLSWLQHLIMKYHPRIKSAFSLRFLCTNSPDQSSFLEENPCEAIDSFLMETDNDPIEWFPDISKTIKAVVKPAPVPQQKKESVPKEDKNKTTKVSADIWYLNAIKNDLSVNSFTIKLAEGTTIFDNNIRKGSKSNAKIASITKKGTGLLLECLKGVVFVYHSQNGEFKKLSKAKSCVVSKNDILSFESGILTFKLEDKLVDYRSLLEDEKTTSKRKEKVDWDVSLPSKKKKTTVDEDDEYEEWKPSKVDSDDEIEMESGEGILDEEDMDLDTRVPCKYGANCHQKNPLHHKKYSHPNKT